MVYSDLPYTTTTVKGRSQSFKFDVFVLGPGTRVGRVATVQETLKVGFSYMAEIRIFRICELKFGMCRKLDTPEKLEFRIWPKFVYFGFVS